jgi:hypothetical protein
VLNLRSTRRFEPLERHYLRKILLKDEFKENHKLTLFGSPSVVPPDERRRSDMDKDDLEVALRIGSNNRLNPFFSGTAMAAEASTSSDKAS